MGARGEPQARGGWGLAMQCMGTAYRFGCVWIRWSACDQWSILSEGIVFHRERGQCWQQSGWCCHNGLFSEYRCCGLVTGGCVPERGGLKWVLGHRAALSCFL